jgi:argininosuccinate lyase
LTEYQAINAAFDADLFNALSLEASVSRRAVYGGTAPDAVKKQMEAAKKALE